MPRLKSRTRHPPHDFQLLLPEVGMKVPVVGSFTVVVDAFAAVVRKNPGLAQRHGWPVTRGEQENFIDEREAARMLAHGWVDFVDMGSPGATYAPPPSVKKNWRGVVAAAIDGVRAAGYGWGAMFGPGGRPVARELAEKRAAVCVGCPQNDVEGGIFAHFTRAAANDLMAVLGALRELNVTVSTAEKLGVCKACKCPMRAKVFTPLDAIVKGMGESAWPGLQRENPRCWILQESNRP